MVLMTMNIRFLNGVVQTCPMMIVMVYFLHCSFYIESILDGV